MKKLSKYLETKPIFYKDIDYTKMPRIFSQVSQYFSFPKTIHIIGTNGKGSTGRFLAQLLEINGFSVGHYTSPHIINFNERFYKNKKLLDIDELEVLHVRLFEILKNFQDELSYFEYITFLSFLAFSDCDFLILEAGLGGEFDATNVALKILSIVTPISFDHQNMLGATIEKIATTKINSINNSAIIAPQEYNEVYGILNKHEKKIAQNFYYVDANIKIREVEDYAKKYNLAPFVKQNLYTAYFAVKKLGISPKISYMQELNLPARFQKIAPNITIDVGHNEAAAKEILRALDGKKVVLIYNSYEDKDYKKILDLLKPIILHVELIEIKKSDRKDAKDKIKEYLNLLHVKYTDLKKIDKDKDYLVFGSFSVVEAFIRDFFEK